MSILLKLSWVFLKIGTFAFGGGLVIIPLVEHDVVGRYGWLTKTEFIDAVTLSQITPGPIIISATFIGYKVFGILGAFVATLSVIAPSFVMICLAAQAAEKFRDNKLLAGFFRGARIAVIGMILEAAVSMGRSALVDPKTILIAVITAFCLFRYKISPVWVLVAAGIVGLVA